MCWYGYGQGQIGIFPQDTFAQVLQSVPPWHSALSRADDPNLENTERDKLYSQALELAKASPQPDKYPVQTCLLSRAVFFLQTDRLDDAEKDFRAALAIAEKALEILWSQKANSEERSAFLPAYGDEIKEKEGKIQLVANLKQWVSQVLYQKQQFAEGMLQCDDAFRLLDEHKLQATVLRIRLNKLKVLLLEAVGREKEGMPYTAEADRLRKTLIGPPPHF